MIHLEFCLVLNANIWESGSSSGTEKSDTLDQILDSLNCEDGSRRSGSVHKNLSNKGGGGRRRRGVWIRCWTDPAVGGAGLVPAASKGWTLQLASILIYDFITKTPELPSCFTRQPWKCCRCSSGSVGGRSLRTLRSSWLFCWVRQSMHGDLEDL